MVNSLFPLSVSGATSRRAGKTLVGPVDLTIGPTGTTVVIGPNGAGKTSLLKMLHGIARLSGGSINWACPIDEAENRQAFVFQRPVVLRRSVLDNIAYPLRVRGVGRKQARVTARDWADRVGLGEMLDRQATVLSGGEQQKLALARALVTQPDLLFLDEPCASLDGRAMRDVEQILHAAKSNGTRLIMSTHDMGQARRMADEVLFLLGGHIYENGPANRFFNQPTTPQGRAFLNGDIVV
ncbi:ATP-binding cassette domain-containing protein [Thalassovita sp.]|uniref:ATP-binding cassette domain-containing protein n=1 Tax=Thalassovita sp. TaxID=1979401 RepID=UPI0029DE6B95|nr:ATP-binding cassette domain-containing protein [Thalassovita sp.]